MNYSSVVARYRRGAGRCGGPPGIRVGSVARETSLRICRVPGSAVGFRGVPAPARPPPTQALRRQIKILANARKSVSDMPGRLVDDRDDLGIRQATRPDDAEDADDLVAVGVGRRDQRALAHLGHRILLADRHAQPIVPGELCHEVRETLLLLEGPEQLAG